MTLISNGHDITFLESKPSGYVIVLEDNKEVYRNREYKLSAEWARDTYGLHDNQLITIYREYKEDYDAR